MEEMGISTEGTLANQRTSERRGLGGIVEGGRSDVFDSFRN